MNCMNYKIMHLGKYLKDACLRGLPLLILLGSALLYGKNTLWQVSSGDNSIFILGSIHLMKEDSYPLGDAIDTVFQKSEVLVMELDPDSAGSSRIQAMMMLKGMLPGNQTLRDMLPEVIYKRAVVEAGNLGLPIDACQKFRPWFFAVTLSALKLQQMGFDASHGVDRYFFEKAKKRNMEVLPLESYAFQLNLFNELPDSLEADLVLQTMDDLEIMETEMEQMVDAWKRGNVSKLEEIMTESFQEYPALYQAFLVKRNLAWTDKIARFLEQGNRYFLVVGAGHLIGPESVIDMLEQRGYAVRQL